MKGVSYEEQKSHCENSSGRNYLWQRFSDGHQLCELALCWLGNLSWIIELDLCTLLCDSLLI